MEPDIPGTGRARAAAGYQRQTFGQTRHGEPIAAPDIQLASPYGTVRKET